MFKGPVISFIKQQNVQTERSQRKCAEGSAKAAEVCRRERKCAEGSESERKAANNMLRNFLPVDFHMDLRNGGLGVVHDFQCHLFKNDQTEFDEITN